MKLFLLLLLALFVENLYSQNCYRYNDPVGYALEILVQEEHYILIERKGLKKYVSNGKANNAYLESQAQYEEDNLSFDYKESTGDSNFYIVDLKLQKLNTFSPTYLITFNKGMKEEFSVESIGLHNSNKVYDYTRKKLENGIIRYQFTKEKYMIKNIEGFILDFDKCNHVEIRLLNESSANYVYLNNKNNCIKRNKRRLKFKINGNCLNAKKCNCSEEILQDKLNLENE